MKAKTIIYDGIIALFVVGFAIACFMNAPITSPTQTLWALFPPIVAIGLALITKEAYSSLFIGILTGSLLVAQFNPIHTVDNMIQTGFIGAVQSQAGIFIFLVQLGIIVALVNDAGGAEAFGRWTSKHIKTKVGASISTFILGILIFIDDYFNCLTVGAVMRPVTDKNKISREKLAYLIDATAAPICMIAPISSWAAAVAGNVKGENGIYLFIKAIPYNFYSLLTFVFITTLVLMKFDFGPMKEYEKRANKGEMSEIVADAGIRKGKVYDKGRVVDLILPIVILIGISFFSFVYVGGLFEGKSFVEAFCDTDATVALPWAGMVTLVFTVVYLIVRKVLTAQQTMDCVTKGFNAMVPAILILTMATSLKNMTLTLESQAFVRGALQGMGGLDVFLPAVIFILACLIAFATGTSWGTFGILIPIVLAVFPIGSEMGVICLAACLSGAVCGDHCSPISDTTIMSSAGAQCKHVNHVSTQLPYAITVAVISFVGYIISGLLQKANVSYSWIYALAICSVIVVVTLIVIKKMTTDEKVIE